MRLTKLRAVGPSPIARGVAQMPRQVWRTICRIPMRRHATGGPYTARVAFAVMPYFRSPTLDALSREKSPFGLRNFDPGELRGRMLCFRASHPSRERAAHIVMIDDGDYVESRVLLNVLEELRHVCHPVAKRCVNVEVSVTHLRAPRPPLPTSLL